VDRHPTEFDPAIAGFYDQTPEEDRLERGAFLLESRAGPQHSTVSHARDRFRDDRFAAIVEQDLRDGQHRNLAGQPEYFTTASRRCAPARRSAARGDICESEPSLIGISPHLLVVGRRR
jgi:hypothetical protein